MPRQRQPGPQRRRGQPEARRARLEARSCRFLAEARQGLPPVPAAGQCFNVSRGDGVVVALPVSDKVSMLRDRLVRLRQPPRLLARSSGPIDETRRLKTGFSGARMQQGLGGEHPDCGLMSLGVRALSQARCESAPAGVRWRSRAQASCVPGAGAVPRGAPGSHRDRQSRAARSLLGGASWSPGSRK
jgi:hypothetical protein